MLPSQDLAQWGLCIGATGSHATSVLVNSHFVNCQQAQAPRLGSILFFSAPYQVRLSPSDTSDLLVASVATAGAYVEHNGSHRGL